MLITAELLRQFIINKPIVEVFVASFILCISVLVGLNELGKLFTVELGDILEHNADILWIERTHMPYFRG
jgi:hypothetical protein